MLLFSPRWLFLIPGMLLFMLGFAISAALAFGNFKIDAIQLNVGTLSVASMTAIVGFQLVAFAFYTKVFAIAEGLLPDDPKLSRVLKIFTLEKGILLGLAVLLAGIILLLRAIWIWGKAHFGELPSMEENLRHLIPAATLIVLGIQGIFSSFFMSALGLKTKARKPPAI
jgi:hypothetical protein